MGKLKDRVLFNLVREYLTVYLPKQRCASPNTIRSYKKTLEMFLEYAKRVRGIQLFDVTFDMLNRDTVAGFLDDIEEKQHCGVSTRNQRLASIKAFLKYCSDAEPSLTKYYLDVGAVPVKKSASNEIIEYMSERAIRILFEQPDTSDKKELRDLFLMVLLYDSAARVQELLDLRICDVHLGQTPTLTLLGKGRKYRTVPLTMRTVKHFQNYLRVYHAGENEYSVEPLFYTVRRGTRDKLSAQTVRVFLLGYGAEARKYCPEIPENVHPHLFRHSRAMHLYQNGMDLTLISQWLGHANLQTTLVYAHADTEQKRAAIELATGADNPMKQAGKSIGYHIDDEETLKKLYGLK